MDKKEFIKIMKKKHVPNFYMPSMFIFVQVRSRIITSCYLYIIIKIRNVFFFHNFNKFFFIHYNIEGTGRDDERFYLNKDEHGWNVYYAERGCKTTNKYFNSESEALEYICKRLTE